MKTTTENQTHAGIPGHTAFGYTHPERDKREMCPFCKNEDTRRLNGLELMPFEEYHGQNPFKAFACAACGGQFHYASDVEVRTATPLTQVMRCGSHILAALKQCPHCPFLAKWSEHAEGILYDDVFTEQMVDDWINLNPWPCHQHMDGTACCGQKLFRAGALDVTRDELVAIWVNELPPGSAEPVPQ